MTVCEITLFLLLGAFLGVVGQVARVVVGLKKNIDKSSQGESWDWFNAKQLIISIMIGGAAGTLAAISLLGEEVGKHKRYLL